ncbi:MAG: T9SS type A sorting domain-containing protein [Lentimicrobium sp.]|nr:T9SS type A sorting domain-containing protein [Lentimicrobium sp.]
MKKIYTFLMLPLIVLAALFVSPGAQSQVVFAQWTFDNSDSIPAVGNGAAYLIGGVSSSYATGTIGGKAWNTANYPAQGTASGTAGVQFNVSTEGYAAFGLAWDQRASNTAANRTRLQYTINGTDWINFEASETNALNINGATSSGFDDGRYITDAGAVWFKRSANFASIPGVGNNATFAFRLVAEFVDGANYGAASPTGSYGTGGTHRFDNVTLAGAGSEPIIVILPNSLSGFTYAEGHGPSVEQTLMLAALNLDPVNGMLNIQAPDGYEFALDGATFVAAAEVPYVGGALHEVSVSVRLNDGLTAGSYTGDMIITGGGAPQVNVSLSGSVTGSEQPALGNVTVPMYIQGSVPNGNRLPFAYRAMLTNLLPSSTYRYYNKVVLRTDNADYNGAGNCIFVDVESGSFMRTTSSSLTTAGQYGEFTSDDSGSYAGWFITEPTGNATRFKPGTELFARIMLNDGAGGTTEVTRLTSTDSFKVLTFNTMVSDTTGTAVRSISDFSAKNFVFIYDNTNEIGRPLYGTHVEASGVEFVSGTYAPFYTEQVAGVSGSWGAIIPNMNSNGIKRIVERNFSSGEIVNTYTSETGTWGSTQTIDPTGGLENVLVIDLTLGIGSPVSNAGKVFVYNNLLKIQLTRSFKGNVELINLFGQVVASHYLNGSEAEYALELATGLYLVRLQNSEQTIVSKVFVK